MVAGAAGPLAIGRQWSEFTAAVEADVREFSWASARGRRALATGVAVIAAVLLALELDLDFPMWSAITAFLVTQGSTAAIVLKSVLRIVGTFAGALIAAVVVSQFAQDHLALAASLFVSVSYALYRSYLSPYSYAWLLVGITIGVVLMSTIADPGSGLHVAAYRAAEIGVGVLATLVVGYLMLPASDPVGDKAILTHPDVSRRLAARTALEAGFGLIVVLQLYDWLDFPGLASASVSITRIADPIAEAGHHRGFLRLIGCIVGGTAGLLPIVLGVDDVIPLLFWLFVPATALAYFASGGPAAGYAGLQGGITFLLTMTEGKAPAQSLDAPIDRLAGILVAILVFWAIELLFDRPEADSGAMSRAT